jgi:hypothetical protein
VAVLAAKTRLIRCALLLLSLVAHAVLAAPAPTEEQVKAVFVFNFSHFVEWPAQTFASPGEPFVIGVLGDSAFGDRLEEAVRGETIDQHALTVRKFRSIADIKDCQILYIDRSQIGQLRQISAALGARSTLTVADADKAAERGVMIQFVTESNRIRLRINVEAARAAGLTISSKLLRPAEIVAAAGD